MLNESPNTEKQIYSALDAMNIKYDIFKHRPAETMLQSYEIDAEHGIISTHCKNLFLTNRTHSDFYLFLLRSDKRFKTSIVSKQVDSSRLQFAQKEDMLKLINCEPGSASPLGLIFAPENKVDLIIDEDLLNAKTYSFLASNNKISILIDKDEFFKMLKKLNIEPLFVQT